ncbi:TPA: hypothetical protein I8220_001273, partial [Aeromonas hydrophila]|uniref:hypothetical protein n=1 Tax=Aeromonas hydrophila TaxID=644 RepID=UPI0013B40D5D|nr:hypothetical protein [Aeromonas hydrophila]HAT2489896.1 hypothetical protein [Aeromonas hydrophila]HAT2494452.1 hypothetical protein [Aeromonas hydrophila]HAT2510097.1 hypothetical protein [Aeromonas hydrophila]HAT2530546.1 hypothetical protein [Aeromonas hydrophila]
MKLNNVQRGIMELIYKIIQENPDYFTWVFCLINVLWGLFMYFNKQSHDRAIEKIKHDFSLDIERRRAVFELKVAQYEMYVSRLDDFGRKFQIDIREIMEPVYNKYFKDYLDASLSDNKDKEREVICWFNSEIAAVMRSGSDDLLMLYTESNKLKLTASDEMLATFSRLEALTKATVDKSHEFMSNFLEIIINKNNNLAAKLQGELSELAVETQSTSKELMSQMRKELQRI